MFSPLLRFSLVGLVGLAFAVAAAPGCSLTGPFYYSLDNSTVITFGQVQNGSTYVGTCTPQSTCGWAYVTAVVDTVYPSWGRLQLAFDNGLISAGWLLGSTCADNVIYFGGQALYSAQWCRVGNTNCTAPFDTAWTGGIVHILEVSHSDIGWLGEQDDMLVDAANINASLDMMAVDPTFKWQHECILFLRIYIEMYPEREEELLLRMSEGRFDIGGTFSEGYESSMLNEILARQMYTGRKWLLNRYPQLTDAAVVAFHQDGPLRSAQTAQVFAKAGMRYLKHSRYSEKVYRLAGLDGKSSLLVAPQLQYCEGSSQWGVDVQDIMYKLSLYSPQFHDASLPPHAGITIGCDYAPPTNQSALFAAWAAADAAAGGGVLPALQYSHFHEWLDALNDGPIGIDNVPVVAGERPNIWIYECTPTHHWLFSSFRDAGRTLPAAEAFAAFYSLVARDHFTSYPSSELDAAWLNLTLDDHGIAPEVVPKGQGLPAWFINDNSPDHWDEVYADKYARANDAGTALLLAAQSMIAQNVNTAAPPNASAVVVFNALSWTRSDPVFGVTPLSDGPISVFDSSLAPVPSQRSANGSLLFVADVPSFGFATYFMMPPAQARPAVVDRLKYIPPGSPWTTPFSNAFYTVTPGRGGISSWKDLLTGVELFDTHAYDVGEWMELQYTGMGASETRSFPSPWVNASTFSRLGNMTQPLNWTCFESGPVRTVFATSPVQTAHSVVTLTLELYETVKRADLRVDLDNWDSAFGVVNRVVFPVASDQSNVSYAVPFGVVRVGVDESNTGFDDVWLQEPGAQTSSFTRGWEQRPREVGDWVHAEGFVATGAGVTISSSVGAWDWVDPTGAYPATQPVLAPEMLVHTNSNKGPFLPEPGHHTFLFSVTGTTSGWGHTWRAGVNPNNPFTHVATAVRPSGALPSVHSFLNVTGGGAADPDVWITAVKKQDGAGNEGLAVRLFGVSATDQEGVTLSLNVGSQLAGAATTDLIELNPVPLPGIAGQATVSLDVGHWAIETLALDVDVSHVA